ncbi:unnamed protein product, partial [Cylicostephanus goldi]
MNRHQGEWITVEPSELFKGLHVDQGVVRIHRPLMMKLLGAEPNVGANVVTKNEFMREIQAVKDELKALKSDIMNERRRQWKPPERPRGP